MAACVGVLMCEQLDAAAQCQSTRTNARAAEVLFAAIFGSRRYNREVLQQEDSCALDLPSFHAAALPAAASPRSNTRLSSPGFTAPGPCLA